MDQPPPSQLRSTLQGLVIVLASAIISNVCATALVMAWTGPSSFPPAGNVAAPINVSSTNQVKNANLAVNGLSVFGNSLLNPGAYLNWGTTAGSGGYGMRDAGGILEFKTATGTWQSIQAIITSVTASSSNSWSSGPGGSIYYSAGNVGVGTSSAPPAVLSVAGAMRLSPRTSAPVTCNASYIGAIAVSDSTSHLCVCNGTSWVYDYNGAACVWGSGGVTPGSQSYTTAGSSNFTVPSYNNLTVTVWGGGGGGGSTCEDPGAAGAGGQSSIAVGGITTILANGGGAGSSAAGAGGTASGGTTNTTGGAGTLSFGGGSPNGGAGGGVTVAGTAPGGGGGPGAISGSNDYGGGGGGYSTRTYSAGALTVGSNIGVVVGGGGAGGLSLGCGAQYNGANGAVGRVTISWN